MVPSGDSVQLSARSGSTSAVVTLPSLIANRVSPRNMKREMACDCPSVLECGSSVSGSLAAMLTIFFFCASAAGGPATVRRLRMARAAMSAWLGMEYPLSDELDRWIDHAVLWLIVLAPRALGAAGLRQHNRDTPDRQHAAVFDHLALRRAPRYGGSARTLGTRRRGDARDG